MRSVILQTSTLFLSPLLLLASIFLLLRGHQEPGGGFAGGLIAGAAGVLYALAYGIDAARRVVRARPVQLMGAGLCAVLASGLPAIFSGRPFLTGLWTSWRLPGGAQVGTPLLFDLGIFLVTMGAVLLILFFLAEEV